jgi:hypothetical protein
MPPRLKRLIGNLLLVAFVIFYAVIAISVGHVIIASKTKLVQFIYFVVAGLAWVPPAGLIVWLMYRGERRAGE